MKCSDIGEFQWESYFHGKLNLACTAILLVSTLTSVAFGSAAQIESTRSVSATEVVYSSKSSFDESRLFRRVTPFAGVTYSSLDGQAVERVSPGSSIGYVTGFTGGAIVDIGGSRFVIETGLIYRRTGAMETGSQDISFVGDSVRESYDEYLYLDYLSIPILAKYYFMEPKKTSFFGRIGVLESFLLNTTLAHYSNVRTQVAASTNTNIEKNEMGAQIGIGISVPVEKNVQMVVSFDYFRSLTTIKKDLSLFNTVFMGNAGVSYSF